MYIPDDIGKQIEEIRIKFRIISLTLQVILDRLCIDNRFDEETKAQFNGLASTLNNLIPDESE